MGSKASFYALGGAGGAALGGILGSVLGPQGAVVGALLGGVTGLTAVAVTDFWDELTSAYDKITAAASSISESVDSVFGSGANVYLWGGMAGALIGGIAGLAAGPLGFPIGAMLGLKVGVITGLTTAWYFNNQEDIKKAYNTVVSTVDSINKGIDDVFGEGAHNYLWNTIVGSLTFGVMGLMFGGPVGAALGLTAGAIAGASYKWYFDNIETVKKTYNYIKEIVDKISAEIDVPKIIIPTDPEAYVLGTAGGGIIGFLYGGPVGAIVGAIAGGVIVDQAAWLLNKLGVIDSVYATSKSTGEKIYDYVDRLSSRILVAPDAYILGTAGGALFGMLALRHPFGGLIGAAAGFLATDASLWILNKLGIIDTTYGDAKKSSDQIYDTTVRISSMIAVAPDAYILGTAGGALFGMIALRSPFGALLGAVVGAGIAHSYVWVMNKMGILDD